MPNVLTEIACKRSTNPISVNSITRADGVNVRFVIDEEMALIDNRGNIRFFVIDYDDGERCGYLLQPYYKKVSNLDPLFIKSVSWVTDAFAAYGLSKARTKLTNTKNAALDIATFFAVRAIGQSIVTPVITSFTDDLFSHNELNFGYRNIVTDKLVFLEHLQIS